MTSNENEICTINASSYYSDTSAPYTAFDKNYTAGTMSAKSDSPVAYYLTAYFNNPIYLCRIKIVSNIVGSSAAGGDFVFDIEYQNSDDQWVKLGDSVIQNVGINGTQTITERYVNLQKAKAIRVRSDATVIYNYWNKYFSCVLEEIIVYGRL